MTRNNILSQFINEQGVIVTVFKPVAPRKGERTWVAIRGSVANMGAKANALNHAGINARVHG